MIVTYVRHAEYTRAGQAGQADRSHACGYINNCTCLLPTHPRPSRKWAGQHSTDSTKRQYFYQYCRKYPPVPGENTATSPLLTAHLSPLSQGRQKVERESRLEYNPDVKVCGLAGLRERDCIISSPKGRRRQAGPRVRGFSLDDLDRLPGHDGGLTVGTKLRIAGKESRSKPRSPPGLL